MYTRTLGVLIAFTMLASEPSGCGDCEEDAALTPTVELATPSSTAAPPTETPEVTGTPIPTAPACATTYPAANTAWILDGTTTWAIDDGPTWTTSVVVSASANPCEPWSAGWGHVQVTTADGEELATVSLPFQASVTEWDPTCPECSVVWSVFAELGGTGSDPDDALALLPASWLEAWTDHRQGVGIPDAVGDPAPIWWDLPSLYPPGQEVPDAWEIGYYASKAPAVESQKSTYPAGDWTLAPSSYWPLTGPTGAVWSFGGVVRQRADGTMDWDGVFQISAWSTRALYNAGAPPTCTQPVVGWGITEVPDERARAACPSCTLAHRLSMTQTVIPLPDACPNDPKLDEFARLFGGHHFAYQASPPAIWTDFSTDLVYAQTLIPVGL